MRIIGVQFVCRLVGLYLWFHEIDRLSLVETSLLIEAAFFLCFCFCNSSCAIL